MKTPTPWLPSVHRLFEAHAERRPAAPAIQSGSRILTYGELDERSNQLARHLRRRGVQTGNLVGLILDRSPDAVVAILAILKAGAAYVPLDPTHPAARLRHIVSEAGIETLVSDVFSAHAARDLGSNVVLVDDPLLPWQDESRAGLSALEIAASPNNLSYVLYTSGSTGRPKGVMTEHRNVASFVAAFNSIVRLTPNDRVFQGFSLGFDGSVEEIWMALSNGAALVVPPRGAPRFGDDLAALLTAAEVTVFSTVPTVLSTMSQPLPNVRLLIVSGERCSKELVSRWATPERRMLNVYGPTETTVNATSAECRSDLDVTIGKPLPGYEVRVLDEEGRAVGPDQVGELYIAGPGVARGYLNQADLTNKHFIQPSGSGWEGVERAYRTGDRVRQSADGTLVFLGRVDDQVKVRGYRIELSEIEAVLGEHASIGSAVVRVVDTDGTSELAAYVVARDPARGVDRNGVAALLTSRLPTYMVPTFLDVVGSLPMLSSGKIDRNGFPFPKLRLERRERPIRRPQGDLETALHGVFCSVLKNDTISVDDDFFLALGGYSLLAARLVSDLRKDFAFDVAIRDLYEHPTVEKLAAHLKSKLLPEAPPPRASGIRRTSSRTVFQTVPRVTRAACKALELVALYVIAGVFALPYLGWLLPIHAYEQGTLSLERALALWLLVLAGAWPAMLVLSVIVKWTVIGRYKPGTYPLWGWYYLRFWLVRRLEVLALPGLLAGTPLLSQYLRLLGARVGKRCTIDTAHCAIPDLLSIGDDSSIGSETTLLGYRVEDGFLRIGSVQIGNRCFVGTHSVLGLDVRMGDDSRLDDLSLLLDGRAISRGQSARGSPAHPGPVAVPELLGGPRPSSRRRALFGLLHLIALYGLGLLLLPSVLPAAAILRAADRSANPLAIVLCTPAAGVAGILSFCLWSALVKRMILPRVHPGVYRVDSFLYLRKWTSDTLMQAAKTIAKPLYTTIYLPPWLRLLGAKIGRRAEISTVSQISPELTEIGEQSFFADGSIIGGRRSYRGVVALTPSRIGRRSFVGNSAILPVGKSLGDGCLLGCLSIPPDGERTPDGTEWLGSPSFALPYRERIRGFDESVTHEPTAKLIAGRLAVDALRIAIPWTIFAGQLDLFSALMSYGQERLSAAAMVLMMPAAAMASAVLGLVCVVVTKKALMGTFRPIIKPLWSPYVWLNEVVNGTYETVAAPILSLLLGTPYCAPWLRLMGCKIGRCVYLETTLFSEFDLVRIGDYAALNVGAVVQNHLFEDRIMKSSTLTIGDNCSVGTMAVVLYDTEMKEGSSVGPLSLLMKGEVLPPQSRWVGIPTAQMQPAPQVTAPAQVQPAFGRKGTLVDECS